MSKREKRLADLRRKFRAVWKERDKMGVVIEMPYAARSKDVLVSRGLFHRLTDAFEKRWRNGQNTFAIWRGVLRDFPNAEPVDLEYAAKFANRCIQDSGARNRRRMPRIARAVPTAEARHEHL
jgi:hypothetical protein